MFHKRYDAEALLGFCHLVHKDLGWYESVAICSNISIQDLITEDSISNVTQSSSFHGVSIQFRAFLLCTRLTAKQDRPSLLLLGP